MTQRVLVTGATGYVGSHIVAELRTRKHEVVSVARSGDVTATGSVFDHDFVWKVTEGADAVVSALPALTEDGRDVGDAMEMLTSVAAEHGDHQRLAAVIPPHIPGAHALLVGEPNDIH